ncbi:PAQR family membrane homeostasis protein TrhA [Candidatus Phytoplasma pini]|uniref:Hemolysin III n=1 Tax=Candidatus Phytoplasma pini TaxID=267362 RepID=A0A559KIW6_9MOLU|nr:hemolysin III family protein [Candidatus Phytoplasma pini]TVY12072.1 hemolysin III [Candidatus Phytoplasma pini]
MTWCNKKKKYQTLGEEIANSISHGLMVFFSIFIFIFYIIKKRSDVALFPLLLFCSTMFTLYLSSCLYHSLSFTKIRNIFQIFDHICIYILIWGSFIPFLFNTKSLSKEPFLIPIPKKFIFFLSQSIIVFLAIILKILLKNKQKKLHLILYLLLGWSSLIIINDLISDFWQNNPKIIISLILGGLMYTLGIFFYINLYKKYYHFIWHLFVVCGTIFHAISIYFLIT